MIAIDTNVLVRLMVQDDHEHQSARAAAVFESDAIYVARTVLLETAWLLRSTYRFGRSEIAAAFRRLVGFPHLRVEDTPAVLRALDWFEGGMDFADALHLASVPAGATFMTFDRALVWRAARADEAPAAVEVPA